MKLLVPALILPVLLFALSGDWLWRGDGTSIYGVQSPFDGVVSVGGLAISNTMASVSALLAFAILVVALMLDRKSLALLSMGALVLPAVHSWVYLTNYYTVDFRNGYNHVAFMLSIGCTAMAALWSLVASHIGHRDNPEWIQE